ncbi:hypothetical protein Tco_1511824, partial [Tanacetum coccineum]
MSWSLNLKFLNSSSILDISSSGHNSYNIIFFISSQDFPFASAKPRVATWVFHEVDNLRDRQGVLMRKMEEVSDAEATNSVAIGGIHPRVTAL